MFNNIALDVFIGLIFIFFLYSLLATILQEMLAKWFNLRSRMLQKSIRRMLEDDTKFSRFTIFNAIIEIWCDIVRFFAPNYWSSQAKFTKAFFNYPTIKYLAQSSWNSKPSYIDAGNFSKTIIYLLRGEDFDGTSPQMNMVRAALFTNKGFQSINDDTIKKIDLETLKHLQKLFLDANNDLGRFRGQLENWFNDTMDRASGWYIRQTRLLLFLIGFFLAYNFNIDTIATYNILAKDKGARDNLVQLAISSIPKYDSLNKTLFKDSVTTIGLPDTIKGKKDTIIKPITKTVFVALPDSMLRAAQITIQKDADKASSIAALGWPDEDSCKKCDSLQKILSYAADKDSAFSAKITEEIKQYNAAYHCAGNPYQNKNTRWIGWLLTAFAISLGAPFWFDLLNKLVALRNTGNKPKESDDATNATNQKDASGNSPINRVG